MNKKSLVLLVLFVVIGASTVFVAALSVQHKSVASGEVCKNQGTVHTVRIEHDQALPSHVTAKLCDTLKITNLDNEIREIGFGEHEHHTAYDGVTERVLNTGESLTVSLNQTGNHTFHDHFHDEVAATFTVN